MKTLVVVDMQNDFIDGVLGSPEAQAIVPKVAEFIKNWDGEIVYTMDTHELAREEGVIGERRYPPYKDSIEGQRLPLHCEKYSDGWCLNDAILEVRRIEVDGKFPKQGVVVEKASFGSGSLEHYVAVPVEKVTKDGCEYIDWEAPEEIVLVGLCTDICVISNALILRAEYPKVPIKVIAGLCAGSTPENHEAALKVMRACCIDVEE